MSYSSKPTGGVGASQGFAPGVSRHGSSAVDWMCTDCGCVNFARRTSCFQVLFNFFLFIPICDCYHPVLLTCVIYLFNSAMNHGLMMHRLPMLPYR